MEFEVCISDVPSRQAVVRTLRPHAVVHVHEVWRSVLDGLRKLQSAVVPIVITDLRDVHGRSSVPAIIALRERHPGVPIIALVHTGRPLDVAEIVPAVRAGVNELVLYPVHGDLWSVLRDASVRLSIDRTDADICAMLAQILTPDALALARVWIPAARQPWDVGKMAGAVGVHRATLVKHLRRVGLPAPAQLLMWVRLLVAARLLEDPGRRVACAAREVRFPSAVALRRAFIRLVGCGSEAVRRAGGANYVAMRFASDCAVQMRNASVMRARMDHDGHVGDTDYAPTRVAMRRISGA